MRNVIRTTGLMGVLALLAWAHTTVSAAPKEGDFSSGWNTWEKAEKGEWAEYAIGDGGASIRQEVIRVNGGKITYVHKSFMKGKETSSKERTRAWKDIKVQGKLPYGKEDTVKWEEGEVELAGKTIKCTVAKWTIGERATEIWYSESVPCGGIVKTTTNGADIVWLTDYKSNSDDEGLPKFYAAKGNHAVYKITKGEETRYEKREVTEVLDDSAKWTSLACDKTGKGLADAKPAKHEMRQSEWDKLYAKPDKTDIELTTDAGTLVCDKYERANEAGETVTEWYREGLLVKKEVTGGETCELIKYEMK